MKMQRIVWIIERILVYSLLFLLSVAVVYTLSHDMWLFGLIFLVVLVLALYRGVVRIKIPEYSVVVRDGKVVFLITETTIRNRFDFVSRGQTVVELPHYGLLDRPYTLEIISPDSEGGLSSCRLSLHLDFSLELAAVQKGYDSFITHGEKLSLEVRRRLLKSAAHLVCWPPPVQGEESVREFLKPIIAELDLGLESVGLKVEEARCSFFSDARLVRFVAAEQELVEKSRKE